MEIVLIALFGAAGCVSRYALSGVAYRVLAVDFPYGTLAVNVIGSLLLGFFVEGGARFTLLSPEVRTAVAIGFFGGFTTFSTFSYETIRMFEEGSYMLAGLNIILSLFVCLLAALGGILLIRYIS